MYIYTVHRWAHLLRHQLSITVYHLLTKENKVPFSVSVCINKRKFAVSVFLQQKANGSRRFLLVPFSVCENMETWRWRYGNLETQTQRHGNRKKWIFGDIETRKHQTENQPQQFSLTRLPFANRAKRRFAVCPFVDEEKNGSYSFANGLNGKNRLKGLARLCIYKTPKRRESYGQVCIYIRNQKEKKTTDMFIYAKPKITVTTRMYICTKPECI